MATWEVIGGREKGGIIVRAERDLASDALDRLATGSLVREVDLDGDRLQYEKLSETRGPKKGWVSVRLKQVDGHVKELLVKRSSAARDGDDATSSDDSSTDSRRKRVVVPTGSRRRVCDKCDGNHPTKLCPHFKGERDDHKDAWVNYGRDNGPLVMGGSGGDFVLKAADVVPQPGDGSCLFHSLAYGLSKNASAYSLRREIAAFLAGNRGLEIAGDTIEEWVRWDANQTVEEYARRMSYTGWGGGIEMAAFSIIKRVNVHVYERASRGFYSSEFKRISCFDFPGASKTIHVLYQGSMHYDALVPL